MRKRLTATLLALLLLIAFSTCGNNTLSSMHPNIAQSGTSASVELSVPADIKIDSAGETAKLYELTVDEAAAIFYIMTGEGTNANGEKETFDIIIDALK